MKVNYLGIFAGIIALSSLLWPWWTLDLTYRTQSLEVIGEEVSVYPYQIATTAFILLPDTVLMNLWFGWATLVLIVANRCRGSRWILGRPHEWKTWKNDPPSLRVIMLAVTGYVHGGNLQ